MFCFWLNNVIFPSNSRIHIFQHFSLKDKQTLWYLYEYFRLKKTLVYGSRKWFELKIRTLPSKDSLYLLFWREYQLAQAISKNNTTKATRILRLNALKPFVWIQRAYHNLIYPNIWSSFSCSPENEQSKILHNSVGLTVNFSRQASILGVKLWLTQPYSVYRMNYDHLSTGLLWDSNNSTMKVGNMYMSL